MQDITKTLQELRDNSKYISIILIDEIIHDGSIQNHLEIYNFIYKSIVEVIHYRKTDLNQDKINRIANIIAVKWTHGIYVRLQNLKSRLKILKG